MNIFLSILIGLAGFWTGFLAGRTVGSEITVLSGSKILCEQVPDYDECMTYFQSEIKRGIDE